MSAPAHDDAIERQARLLAVQDELAELGLHDLEQRWRMQPDRQVLTVGAGQQQSQTIAGNPTAPFRGVAVYNTTLHTLSLNFAAGGGAGSPLTVPPKALLVWPAQYADLAIGSDVVLPAETFVLLRLPYPPDAPRLSSIGTPSKETWSEEETGTAATVKLKLAGKPGRRIVVTSIIGLVSNSAAVGAAKVLQGSIKRGANTIFRFSLQQSNTAGAGGLDRFTSGPINLTLAEGEELVIEVEGAEANVNVIINASGFYE